MATNTDREECLCTDCQRLVHRAEKNCPACGSSKKTIRLFFEDEFTLREQLKGKTRDRRKTGKNKIPVEFVDGHEQSHNGEWVYKQRIFDRVNKTYFEKVEKSDGTVIHLCDENLENHFGHGSDKPKKDTDMEHEHN